VEREDIEAALRSLDPSAVSRVARAALASDSAAVTQWRWEPLRASLGLATGGLYRVTGAASVCANDGGHGDGTRREWSAILKVVRPPTGARHAATARTPTHWSYWKREPLAYSSGFLAGLVDQAGGGLAAPRCLWADERTVAAAGGTATTGAQLGESVWLWLEQVVDRHAGWWPAERTLLAARHLGAFGGAYLDRPPTAPWLGHGYLRQRVERAADRLPLFEDDDVWRRDRLGGHFDPSLGARLRDVWARRWDVLDQLDALPRTLCHGDSHRGNLFASESGTGTDQPERTVAIDWGTMGIGPVGADLAELALSRAIGGELRAPGGADFGERLFEHYAAGLRDAGRSGDVAAARTGYAATAALAGTSRLHWTLERALTEEHAEPRDAPRWQDTDDVLRRWAALAHMFLAL
jgi:hypothetical protein